MTWATEQDLPAMQKIVLLMMANRFNEDQGVCWPSHETLAKECGMDRRSIIRQIDKLTCLGLISVIKNVHKNNLNSVNQYRLNLEKIGKLKKDKLNKTYSDTESLRSDRKSQGSDRESLGVVTESHTKLLIETIKEPIKEKRDKKEKSATRINPNWTLSEKNKEYCLLKRPDLNPDITAEKFFNHWVSKPGKDASKLDWDATWRNWVLSERQCQQPQISFKEQDRLREQERQKEMLRAIQDRNFTNEDINNSNIIEGMFSR